MRHQGYFTSTPGGGYPGRRRWAWAAALTVIAWSRGVAAEVPSTTRVSATSRDALFAVDGQVYSGAAIFTWPAGSKHTLEIAPWQLAPTLPKTRFTFQRWSTAAGAVASPANRLTITADPGVPWYNADLSVDFAVTLNYYPCTDGACAAPGTIWINQVAYQHDADVWIAAGSAVAVEAVPASGYVFAGWGQNGGALASVFSMTLNASLTLYPRFAPARAIRLETIPDGLQLLADRATVTSPATLEWGWNTAHSLDAVSPQWDRQGRPWILSTWSDGVAGARVYEMLPGTSIVTLAARFVPAVAAGLYTEPPGLSLVVDGTTAASPRTFAWAPGQRHTVGAPSQATDSQGGLWAFRQWSNGGPQTQVLSITDADVESGIRMTARFEPMSRIRLDSVPAGLLLSINGTDCRAPCEGQFAAGSTVRLGVPPTISISPAERLELNGLEGTDTATFVASSGYRKITAYYRSAYRLSVAADPAEAGIWHITPATADGFLAAGTPVSIGVEPVAGMTFRGWDLDLDGRQSPQLLVMDGPRSVRALFDKLPGTPAPPRVTNSASDTLSAAVAPGSIASLFGTELSESTAAATSDPLPQSLAGVSLVCSGGALPLAYVSPRQINFQVPAALAPGVYRLFVHRTGAPVLATDLTVARNAPGLLLVTFADGSPVSGTAPVRAGDTILVYGTGFGPSLPAPLDGFKVSDPARFPLADPVTVFLQGRLTAADFSGLASGLVGIAVVRLTIPLDLDLSSPLELSIRSGEALSNTLVIPTLR